MMASMNGNRAIVVVAGMVAAMCFLSPATGLAAWLEPERGWEVAYSATSGTTPDNSSQIQQWTRTNYGAETLVTTDGDVDALRMDRANHTNPRWSSTATWAQGGSADKMTIDLNMRMIGKQEYSNAGGLDTDFANNDYQFYMAIARPVTAAQQAAGFAYQQVQIWFAQDKIQVGIPDAYTLADIALGTSYNDIRVLVDWESGAVSVYLNDGTAVAATGQVGARTGTAANSVTWGHASKSLRGSVFITDIKITNSELAAIPEPATVSMLLAGAIVTMIRRRIE